MKDEHTSKSAADFAARWAGKGYEKGESQIFWIELLTEVFGIEHPTEWITFEEQVKLDHTSFIDGHITKTHVLIEQKSLGKDLKAPIKQSDGSLLSPFQQAKRYAAELPYSQRPRWIVTCNFSDFLIYDMEQPNGEPEHIELKNLGREYYRLQFLVNTGDEHIQREMEISLKAGQLVGMLYDKLLEQYHDKTSAESLRSLNILCVRLVFCLYAEDAGVFPGHNMFHDYLIGRRASNVRESIIRLFEVLDTPLDKRDPYMDDDLARFPYVNGGLFAEAGIEIPRFTEEIVTMLLNNASLGFDWSGISPTIFGAVFESTLNPETRRSGGMHYTSIENIHKVIDPLFLDELRAELDAAKNDRQLKALQAKLSALTFLDPACGSGNFLTETFISLRRLENEIIKKLNKDQAQMGFNSELSPIKVSISQFYGIEINDFAVTVARTALWIAEHQMLRETERIVAHDLDFLPLKSYNNIREGDALKLDWDFIEETDESIEVYADETNIVDGREVTIASEPVVHYGKINLHSDKITIGKPEMYCYKRKVHYDYIMGNPPFVGASMMTAEQKAEAVSIFGKIKLSNSIDYVGAWYFKSAEIMKGTNTKCALVSTNSITQGEQVAPLWKTLQERYDVHIDFAYRTFIWDSESSQKAHVHCVIIGFSCFDDKKPKRLFYSETAKTVSQIHPYLIEAPNVFIESRSTPICDVPRLTKGNQPSDGGNLILTDTEKEEILSKYPELTKFIHPYLGSEEIIKNKVRYCLWLVNATPTELSHKEIFRRISRVKEMRERSSAKPTRQKAITPHLFFSITQPKDNYIMIPRVSSETRRYIPIVILPPDVIASDAGSITENASLYDFGVLISNIHMAWMRTVCGRLKSDYRYSGSVVYNNFPWPNPSEEQRKKIEETAQTILDVRAKYPHESLAKLYNEVTMPIELRRAHQANDRAVMAAYGFPIRDFTEQDCVAWLMEMYKEMTDQKH